MWTSNVFTLLIAAANAITPKPCTEYSPDPITFPELPAYFPRQKISKLTDLADIEEIRQTLSQYPFSIDARDFDALSDVFATDAVANYSAPLGVLNGLAAIQTTLSAALSQFPGTQHQLGTQRIRLCEKNTAISATYYRAAHYLNATGGALQVIDDSGVLIAYSQYQDSWVRRNGTWKIVHRNNVYMVSSSGD
jgi:ketosteroid isomerase-like protein